jgi:Rieske Fe-S protein
MKLKDSYLSRRTFLNRLLLGWAAALAGVVGYPAVRFLAPVDAPDPDWVILAAKDYLEIPPNSTKTFAYGRKMGIFMKSASGEYRIFKGVCTHLDCNVVYKPEMRKFFCACHDGWYDEAGKNIAGPPPKPMMLLGMEVRGEKLVVLKPGGKTPPPEAFA